MPDSTHLADDPNVGESDAGTTRRTILRGAVIAGVATPILAACSGGGDQASGSSAPPNSDVPSTSGGPSGGDQSSASGGGGADVIASTSDVPEGGGIILADPGIVITQPTAGEFKGFTNICTHQSCPLDNVNNGTINCICHGSEFSIEDGSPVKGPNGSSPDSIAALAEKPVAVQGTNITLA